MKKIHLAALGLLLFAPAGIAPTRAQQRSQAPLWGDLSAGPYPVGFRTISRSSTGCGLDAALGPGNIHRRQTNSARDYRER
jgi:hypothetical protein